MDGIIIYYVPVPDTTWLYMYHNHTDFGYTTMYANYGKECTVA